MKTTIFAMITLLVCSLSVGCAEADDEESMEEMGFTESAAKVNLATAERAYQLVKAIDYLPFKYPNDGCFARSYVMSMELAANGIPSSSAVISGDLEPTPAIQWRYHVAPMLQVNGVNYVFDPSLASKPTTAEKWVALSRPNPATPTKAFYYPGSFYLKDYRVDYDGNAKMISSMAQMPRFKKQDIELAYDALDEYLQRENASDEAAKRKRLRSRLLTLSNRLAQIGMLQ